MSLQIKGNFELENFFEANPELKYVDDFAQLIKDKGLEKASKIMWAIWLTEHPDSKLYSLGLDIRRNDVKKNFLADKKFNFDDYAWLITSFRRHTMSKKARMYSDYMEIMERRHSLLMERLLDYDNDQSAIDDMVLKGDKMWAVLDKIEREYLNDKDAGIRQKGGGKSSAADMGLLD